MQRFPELSREEFLVIAGISHEELRHTRAARGRWAEGRKEGEAKVTLRQLNRRCGPLGEATTTQIQALPLKQLEALADALLDFEGPAYLSSWLAAQREERF
jgi:predicted transposase YdaD